MRKKCIVVAAVLLTWCGAAEPVCVNGVCYPDEESARAAGALLPTDLSIKTKTPVQPDLKNILREVEGTPGVVRAPTKMRMSRRLAIGYMDPEEFRKFLVGDSAKIVKFGGGLAAWYGFAARGTSVRAAAVASPRIVSCAPAVTETIFDLGGAACLVGRSSACLYPAAATNLPSVGAYSAPSIERIVALAPTHVLMTYLSDPSMSNRLERLGIRVLQFPCERLADYAPMRARLAALCGLTPRRMLAVVQREPMVVAGKETLPDDVLAEVGCVNAVTNRKGYFVLSPEARLKLAPDGEVDFTMDYDLTRLGPQLPAAIDALRRKLAATDGMKRQECRFPEGGPLFGKDAAPSPERPRLVILGAPWCKNSAAMERTTLKDPSVVKALSKFDVSHISINAFDDLKKYPELGGLNIMGVPAYVVFEPKPAEGKEEETK